MPQLKKHSVAFGDNVRCNSTLHLILLIIFILGSVLRGQSQKKSTDSLTAKINLLKTDKNFKETDTTYIKLLYKLGRTYLYQNLDSLKHFSEDALRISEKIEYNKGIAGAKLGLGQYYIQNSEFEKAFDLLYEAESYAQKAKADTISLRSINLNAMAHFMKGDYPNAYILCKRGERIAREKENDEMLVFFLMNMGTSFTLLQDYELALPYYHEALNFVEKSNDLEQKAQIEFNLGYLYVQTKDYTKGEEFCRKAIVGLKKVSNKAWESSAWAALGEIAIGQQKYDKALSLFQKSETLLQLEDNQQIVETNQGFADTYYFLDEIEKSTEYVTNALKIAKETKYYSGIVKANKLLYQIAKKQNRNEDALKHLTLANHISDSILESDNRIKFLMLEAQSKSESEQAAIMAENDTELRKKNLYLIISIFMILALATISFLIYRNARNKRETNQKLKEINLAKTKIFSIIGHDLKSPINTLTELLNLYGKDAITEDEILKIAPKLKDNVDYSAFALNNLLYWAKLEMGKIAVQPTLVEIKKLATTICNQFSSHIQKKELNISCSITPELEVLVDREHLITILKNLIYNAIKYTDKGGRIDFDSYEENGRAMVTITDSGIGMDDSEIELIKKGDYVNSNLGTHNEKGTGIGLQVVQKLISINNGALFFESKKGVGSKFKICFPIQINE